MEKEWMQDDSARWYFSRIGNANEHELIMDAATDKVARIARELIDSLTTDAPAKNREEETLKARAKALLRFGRT